VCVHSVISWTLQRHVLAPRPSATALAVKIRIGPMGKWSNGYILLGSN
jgi:hypothetical protein